MVDFFLILSFLIEKSLHFFEQVIRPYCSRKIPSSAGSDEGTRKKGREAFFVVSGGGGNYYISED
jgi:hypothetical protein